MHLKLRVLQGRAARQSVQRELQAGGFQGEHGAHRKPDPQHPRAGVVRDVLFNRLYYLLRKR